MSEPKDPNVTVGTTVSLDESHEEKAFEKGGVRKAGKLDVFVQGAALFSDGYNIQIAGYMNTVLAKL